MASPNKPSLGAHEKFVFRHAWLKKGVDAVYSDPLIFTTDEALVRLGVGKNMVRSIRHWCLATGLIAEDDLKKRPRPLKLTELGRRLFLPNGWDPYLEDPGTLWLIHWQLATDDNRALVWNLAFNNYYESEFSRIQLERLMGQLLARMNYNFTEKMVGREVDTYLRTYAGAQARGKGIIGLEESLDCPLVELSLIQYNADEDLYRFSVGPKATLPMSVFGYALFQFLRRFDLTQRTVSVDACIYDSGSPGQVFKLDENSVVEYLEMLEGAGPLDARTGASLQLQETAGLRQLYFHHIEPNRFDTYAMGLLHRYYDRRAN